MTSGKKVNNKYGTFKSVNLMFTMLTFKTRTIVMPPTTESETEIATK